MEMQNHLASNIKNSVNYICSLLYRKLAHIINYSKHLFDSLYRKVINILYEPPNSFARIFETRYGPSHPKFFEGSLTEAKKDALRENKLLGVYIHSDHDNASAIALSNPLIVDILDANCILYVEYVKGSRMRRLVHHLGARKLPHLSLFAIATSEMQELVARIEDFRNTDSVLVTLVNAIENPNIVTAKKSTDELITRRNIIKEQDEEYRRAMEEDTARLQKKEMAENNDTMRRRKKEIMEQGRLNLIAERKNLAKLHTGSFNKGDTKIRVRLSSGSTLELAFNKDEPVQRLYDWVGAAEYWSDKNIKIPYHFDLCIPYPSKKLENKLQTLEEANLYPNASLVLVSLDDSDEDDV